VCVCVRVCVCVCVGLKRKEKMGGSGWRVAVRAGQSNNMVLLLQEGERSKEKRACRMRVRER